MEFVILNALIYIVTLFIYWKLKHQIDLGFIIIAAFTLIAVLGIPHHYYLSFIYPYLDITFLPYVYFYIVLILFIRPYLSTDLNLINRIGVRKPSKLKILSYLLIISGIVSTLVLVPTAIKNLINGEWNEVRNTLYSGEDVAVYNNFAERLVLIFNQYFRLISILIFFYYLTFKKVKKHFLILLGLSIVVPVFLLAITVASRGMLINLFMEVFIGFILFKNVIASRIKKKLAFYSLLTISVFIFYSLAVTENRFGEGTGFEKNDYSTNLSLLDYFGQPMLVFNGGVATMHDFANGKHFFKYILDAIGIDSTVNQKALGGSWGRSFFTFIGGFYIDFGPIGTFLLALLLPLAIKKNISRKVIYFENLYLYYFFYIFFLEGVFVTGNSAIISWLFALLIYIYIKF